MAIDLSFVGDSSSTSEKLLINGRYLSVNTGGAGLQLQQSFFDGYLIASATYLLGYAGDASATFSGAYVSGPAKLKTQGAGLRAYLLPTSTATPFLSYTTSRKDGDINFTGLKNTLPINGSSTLLFRNTAMGLGLRYQINPSWQAEILRGRNQWSINSSAKGTVGSLAVSTLIEADNTDPFTSLSMAYSSGQWRYRGEFGVYRLTASNTISQQSLTLSVSYAF